MNAPRWLGAERFRLERVDSTSDELWRRAAAGAAHGTVLSAAEQAAGRGRQGRSWEGRRGDLMVSWLLRLQRTPERVSALSVVQGLALAAALEPRAPGRIALKWPNDLWLDGRKLGGLLLESRPVGGTCIVSGLGLNLRTPEGGWPAALAGRAAALDETGPVEEPETVLDGLLGPLERAIDRFLAEGPQEAFGDWGRWSALDGRAVRWDDPRGGGEGLVLGLADDGGLRVRDAAGRERVLHSGEVHLEVDR